MLRVSRHELSEVLVAEDLVLGDFGVLIVLHRLLYQVFFRVRSQFQGFLKIAFRNRFVELGDRKRLWRQFLIFLLLLAADADELRFVDAASD